MPQIFHRLATLVGGGDRLLDPTTSPGLVDGARALTGQAALGAASGSPGAAPDLVQAAPRLSTASTPGAPAMLPSPQPLARDPQVCGVRRGRVVEGDDGAPPHAVVVALALHGDDAGALEVLEPALQRGAVAPGKPPARLAIAASPAHGRGQAGDELLDRAREPPGPLRMCQPIEVALDGVHAGLEAIIASGRAASPTPNCPQEGVEHRTAGLARGKRRGVGRPPAPALSGAASRRVWALQQHRQRPRSGRQRPGRPGTGVRGTAGQ